jgi:hypothetical protein
VSGQAPPAGPQWVSRLAPLEPQALAYDKPLCAGPPTCAITASPLPAKSGKPLMVDLSGSRVAPGVTVGIKSARVEMLDPKGVVVDTLQISTLTGDVVAKKAGVHTLRANVTDEAGQTSTNTCETQADVKGAACHSSSAPISARSA